MSQIPELEALLEDFFDVCQNPNPAEYALFGDLIGFEEEYIEEWCRSIQDLLHGLSQANLTLKSCQKAEQTTKSLCCEGCNLRQR